MTHFPAFQILLFVFLLIHIAVSSSIEFRRLNMALSVLTSKQDTTQLEIKLLQDEVVQLRDELHQARQHLDVLGGIINETKMKDSGLNKCSCEMAANLTNELQDIRHNGINNSERIINLESFSNQWTDEVQELIKVSSTAKDLAKGLRQEKQLRKDFEMRIDTRLFAIDDIIFNMTQTCQCSSLRKHNDSSTEESAILANSSNTTRSNEAEIRQIYSELQSLKDVIANMSGGKSSLLETITTSTRTTTSSISMTSHLCTRTVTDETLILGSIKVGSRVVRGRDWAWGNQDGVPPAAGTVEKIESLPGWAWVRWDSGMYVNYRVGEGSKFDLYICE